ncbi:MAG: RluA family pseudouridine synthase [Clostridia bacterium]|nr:RluA family pseudouridine synthase [Clostridia bacterium]
MVKILFEDEHIIICEKEVGMLSEDSSDAESLPKALKTQTGNEIFTLHRLDKPVGGVIMYAKSKKSAAAFSEIIANNLLEKTYLAVTDGHLKEKNGEMRDLLFKDSHKNKTFVVKRIRKGVKEAVLDYEVLQESDAMSFVKVKLRTGRSHQIRVQFASRKTPLTGDGKYGSHNNRCTIALWSHSLSFKHPFTNETMTVSSMPDMNIYPWSEFRTESEM